MENLNIIQLIEKNPITRLSKDYENKHLIKIKENFNEKQQKLFTASFYCYLNYNTKKDFVINFDDIWKWLEFSRKDPAKRLLEKYFILDIDYQIEKLVPLIGGASFEKDIKNLHGGQNKETILLTVNTFKKFCLKAGTKKADEVHEYYIKLEELLQETMNEETNELRKQLCYKETELEENKIKIKELSKYVVRKFTTKFKTGNCVYFIMSPEIKDKFKIGSTSNINDRISDLSTASPEYFEVKELFFTDFHKLLEKTIKEIFSKNRISVNCEWYEIPYLENIKNFIISQIELYNNYKLNSITNITDKIDIPIYQNEKTCNTCNTVLNHKYFFFIDKDKRIYYENCVTCYEKEHGECKQCSYCHKIKTKIDFVVDRTKKDGLTYECKECRHDQIVKRKEIIKKENPNLGKKQCITCENFEELKMFFKTINEDENKKKSTIYSSQCKKCYCEENGLSKQCFICQEIKNISEYDKTTANVDGLACYCKTCRKIQRDKERSDKKEIEDPNKKQCLSCEKYLKKNMYFLNYDKNNVITYYDMCIECCDNKPTSLQCNRCKEVKDPEFFSKDSSKKTGYRTLCKICTKNK